MNTLQKQSESIEIPMISSFSSLTFSGRLQIFFLPWNEGLRLLDLKSVHEIIELLPGQWLRLTCVPRPAKSSGFYVQPFVEKDETGGPAARFIVKRFDPVAAPPAEQIQIVGVRIQIEGMLYQRGKPVDLLAHVCVTGDQIDVSDTGQIA